MMHKIIFTFITTFFAFHAYAQGPRVPSQLEFGGMELKITEAARKKIQSEVDALTRSDKYFQLKLERVDLYFPIIERVLREENVPEDFKYLVIQESALISDAVSSSNAVGYWQFKKASGEEVGLRVDGMVDERMNLIASTRGAAKYLKRNNFYFDNWVYTLLSYMTGLGGAQKIADKKHYGADKMDIDKNTHWYVIKFLAHKIAFENAIGKNPNPALALMEYTAGADKSLRDISSELNVDHAKVEDYNKWLKRGRVPMDKIYTVIIPIAPTEKPAILAAIPAPVKQVALPGEGKVGIAEDKYPLIEGDTSNHSQPLMVEANGLPAIIAREGEDIAALAQEGEISLSRFLRFNDLEEGESIVPGQVYYFKRKRNNARTYYHTAMPEETLWSISQKYAIKLNKLLRKNRMKTISPLETGRVLWLRFIRPKDRPVEYREIALPEGIKEESMPSLVSENESVVGAEPQPEVSQSFEDIAEENPEETVMETQEAPEQIEIIAIDVPEDSLEIPTTVTIDSDLTEEEEPGNEDEDVGFQVTEPVNFVVTEGENDKAIDNPKHTVKQGETLFSLSKLYQIPLADLVKWNQIDPGNGIHIGQELIVYAPVESENMEGEATQQGPLFHQVEARETLYSISRKYNVTVNELQQWNGIDSGKGLNIGQQLQVSAPEIPEEMAVAEKDEEVIYHKVMPGETLYKIARDNKVTIKEVMEWNNKKDFTVAQGEVIIIKK